MSENDIKITGLFKKFKIYDDIFVDRLKEKIFFWNSEKYYRHFTALNNINLTVKKGEVLGIIGPNGAGKTTLLKILAKICFPTSGSVEVKGSLVAVLALGLGFNPRFTGRENIAIGGCLLGMSLAEIKEKEKWIIEFSELKQFIDQPIRTYSSGMLARLSFSVAAAVSPDILIIDEALATGDGLFVQKSLGRIHQICKNGTTAIFVSHNLNQIQRLCSERVVLLEKGSIINDDKAYKVIRQYNDVLFRHREEEALKQRPAVVKAANRYNALLSKYGKEGPAFFAKKSLQNKDYTGNGDIVIERAFFTDNNGGETASVKTGEEVSLHLEYNAKEDKKNVKVLIHIENYSGICAYAFQSDNHFDSGRNKLVNELYNFKRGTGSFVVDFGPILLTTNKYLVTITLYDADQILDKNSDDYSTTIFRKQHMAELSVFKPMDLHDGLIFEHPVHVKVVPK